jgi:nitroimidazol reductase NimA-like FMN-containing flavoprotein (pyridoxamine 5'-phosphate oxidase superfamily)
VSDAAGSLPPSELTTVRRLPDRAVYERAAIDAILDEGLVAHVAVIDGDQPVVIPMNYGRAGDRLFLHGLPASRLLRAVADGRPLSIGVTLIDGLVLAKSVFHHSVNYRSVVVFGTGRLLRERAEKIEALRVITEHIVPGRWDDARLPSEAELKQTAVVEIRLEAGSAKVRTGPPKDDPEDADLAVWAGVVPLSLEAGDPVTADPTAEVPVPPYARAYRRPTSRA